MTAGDLSDVVVNVVMAVDVLPGQEDLPPEEAEAFDIQLRADLIVRQIGRSRVADLQLQFVEGRGVELVVVRRQHGAAEAVELAPARDCEQRAGGLIFEDAVSEIEAQIAARTVAEVVIEPRRELRLAFIKRELPRRVGKEPDGSRIIRRRQCAAQLRRALLQGVGRGAPGDDVEERRLISDRRVLRGGRHLKERWVGQQVDEGGLLLIQPLDGGEEEGLVSDNRASEGAAVLSAVEWRFPLRVEIEGVARVELFVAEQPERASVKTGAA